MDILWLCLASFLAGTVDAIVGGGGLILIPTLFTIYPTTPAATLFGINKSASIWGTTAAAWQYSRHVDLPWSSLAWAALACGVGSGLGAWGVTLIDGTLLRRALPFVLLILLGYTLIKKDLGQSHAPKFTGKRLTWLACVIGLLLGAYDGFFGPGTGSFLVFAFVRGLGFDFLRASACAKWLNSTSNLAAVALFAWKGHVWWHLALPMAVANLLGSLIGSRLALRLGSGFVRWVFVVVVGLLVCKTGWDAWFKI